MGLTDLISKSFSGKTVSPSHYDKEFVVVTIKKHTKHTKRITIIHHAIPLVQNRKVPITQDYVIM